MSYKFYSIFLQTLMMTFELEIFCNFLQDLYTTRQKQNIQTYVWLVQDLSQSWVLNSIRFSIEEAIEIRSESFKFAHLESLQVSVKVNYLESVGNCAWDYTSLVKVKVKVYYLLLNLLGTVRDRTALWLTGQLYCWWDKSFVEGTIPDLLSGRISLSTVSQS